MIVQTNNPPMPPSNNTNKKATNASRKGAIKLVRSSSLASLQVGEKEKKKITERPLVTLPTRQTPPRSSLLKYLECRHELYHPRPTSFALTAALLLLDTPLAPGRKHHNAWDNHKKTDSEECVYLIPRSYMTRWIQWAYYCGTHPSVDLGNVPPKELGRLRLALQLSAEFNQLPMSFDNDNDFTPVPFNNSLIDDDILDDVLKSSNDTKKGRAKESKRSHPPLAPPSGAPAKKAPTEERLNQRERSKSVSSLNMDDDVMEGRDDASHPSQSGGIMAALCSGVSGVDWCAGIQPTMSYDDYNTSSPVRNSPQKGTSQELIQMMETLANRHGVQSFSPRIDPGPIDSRELSLMGHPLLLCPGVVVGRGDDENEKFKKKVKNSRKVIKEKKEKIKKETAPIPLVRRHSISGLSTLQISDPIDSPHKNTKQHYLQESNGGSILTSSTYGCVPVPQRFYEMLRSVHGVLCSDGLTVSNQPRVVATSESGRTNNNSDEYDESITGVTLHHHVITTVTNTKKNGVYRRPSLGTTDVGIGFKAALESLNKGGDSITKLDRVVEPVEFRRKLILEPGQAQALSPASKPSPRSRLLQQDPNQYLAVTEQQQLKKNVELYPIKIFYSMFKHDPVDETDEYGSWELESLVSEKLRNSSPVSPLNVSLLKNAAGELKKEKNESISNGTTPVTKENGHGLFKARRNRKLKKQPIKEKMSSSSPIGFVLVSKLDPAAKALQAVLEAASPNHDGNARLWCGIGLSTTYQGNMKLATAKGDGLELVDIEGMLEHLKAFKLSSSRMRPPPTLEEWIQKENGIKAESRDIEVFIEERHPSSSQWLREKCILENRIQVGDFVDAQDSSGKWYEAIVKSVTEDTVKVHYFGWNSRWDSTIRRKHGSEPVKGTAKNAGPPCPLWSQSNRWRENVTVGTEIEIRDSSSLVQRPIWFKGIIRFVGEENDAPRDISGGAVIESHEQESGTSDEEHKLLILLKRTRQVLVEVPQENFNSPASPRNPKGRWMGANPSPSFDESVLSEPIAEPPFIRWVNLYGEEISELGTHLKVESLQKVSPAMIKYSHHPSRPLVEVLKSHNNIFGGGFVRESLRGTPAAPGSIGLQNLGNSCFLNSILQCMNQMEPLTQYFLKGAYQRDLNRNNPLGSGGIVARAYAELLNDMWSGEYSILAPRLLKQTVASFAPQFNNVYQHDSQEFFSFLMDGIHEDLNRVKKKPYVEDSEGLGRNDKVVAMESWRKHLSRHDSIIVDHSQGMHRSHLTCPHCGKESIKFDVFSSISLPLNTDDDKDDSAPISLSACLDDFITGEQLDEENAWYCPKCKKHVCALKMIALWNTPDILVLHLKRFSFKNCQRRRVLLRSKVERKVEFPVDSLDMSPYVLGPIDEQAPPIYKLCGVSEHTGATANSGHYTATVRNSKDAKWYRLNDSQVGTSSGDAAITGGAYVLFYQRVKGRSRWAGMEKEMKARNIDPYGKETIPDHLPDKDGFTKVRSKKGKQKRDKH